MEIVPEEDRRTLSRREQTLPVDWDKLPSSAEDSDDSYKNAKFSNELLAARQKGKLQEEIPIKTEPTLRDLTDKVSIDGKV